MKHIYKIILFPIITLLMLNVSCSDFLNQEPDDLLTLEMVFNDEVRVQGWLADVYSYVPDPYWDYGRRYGFNPLADEVQIPLTWSNFGWWVASTQQGNWSASSQTYDIWGGTYKAVRAANVFMQNVKPLPEKGLSEADVEYMKLECRFLIAFYYAQMLELYGPFPLITGLIDPGTPLEDMMQARTPLDEIVDWLDKELLELAGLLPLQHSEGNTKFGRPTKGAALACRARMLLVAASPLFNGNDMYSQVKNNDGTNLFPVTYDENKWKRAADATKELLDLGIYSLYKEYHPNGNIDPFLSFQNLFLTTADKNPEIIFARASTNDTWEYDKHAQPRGSGGNGAYGITQELVDAFYTVNGLDINSDPAYSESGMSTTDQYYDNTSWDLTNPSRTGGLITPAGTYNMYVNREPRFYITVRYNNQWIHRDGRYTQFYHSGADGLPSYDSPPCGYLVRKRIHPESRPRDNFTPYRPGIIYRLGEFYLNYAEALNEYNPQNPDILTYVNRVRERAGIPGLNPSLLGNKEEMRAAIQRERQVELATEGKRYTDIRRWLTAKSIFSNPITGMNVQGNASAFYERTVFMNRVFEDRSYLWPIYQEYIDKNTNLVQNEGW